MLTRYRAIGRIFGKVATSNLFRPLYFIPSTSISSEKPTREQYKETIRSKYLSHSTIHFQDYLFQMRSDELKKLAIKQKKTDVLIEENLEWNGCKEGKAQIFNSKHKVGLLGASKIDELPFNQSEVFERDTTILVIKEYLDYLTRNNLHQDGVNFLDALSSTGIKSLRIVKEIDSPQIKRIDLADTIKTCPEFYNLSLLTNNLTKEQASKLNFHLQDPRQLMFNSRSYVPKDSGKYKYQIIDINARGSALPYVDYAIQALDENGLLCVTFADIPVLCEDEYQKCYYYYGSSRSKSMAKHEQGIRIALHSINTIANKSHKVITPLFCYYDFFYIRLYMRVHNQKKDCPESLEKTGNIFECSKCPNHKIVPLGKQILNDRGEKVYIPNVIPPGSENCEICNSPNFLNGPVWINPINDYEFIKGMYDKLKAIPENEVKKQFISVLKLEGILYNALKVKEKDIGNIPLGISFPQLAMFFRMRSIPNKEKIRLKQKRAAFMNQGYTAARSYLHKDVWKTNASLEVAFDLMKFWRKIVVPQDDYLGEYEEDSPQYRVLTKPIKHLPKFTQSSDAKSESEEYRDSSDSEDFQTVQEEFEKPYVYSIPNPEWGPKGMPKKPKNNTSN